MKAPKNNNITWCTPRNRSTGKKEVETIVGLPASMDYELFHQQPEPNDIDAHIIYLIGTKHGSRPLTVAIHKDDLALLED